MRLKSSSDKVEKALEVYSQTSQTIFSSLGMDFSADGHYMALAERRDCKDYISIFVCDDWHLLRVSIFFFLTKYSAPTVRFRSFRVRDGVLCASLRIKILLERQDYKGNWLDEAFMYYLSNMSYSDDY